MGSNWLLRLDQTLSSYSILIALLALVLFAVGLERSGFLGWALGLFGRITRWGVRGGFRIWERWLSWANWWVYLLLTAALISVGGGAGVPVLALVCASLAVTMGAVACLAYMFIDVERYEVERGRKAVHNPSKGQDLASNVARYGHRVGVTLLAAAAAAVVGGFALLNQGLYETVGTGWYRVDEGRPGFADFLVYALINVLSLVDVLDLADSQHLLHATFVRKGAWQAAALLGAFRSFFTLILLQQVFASVRQGRLLSETIADFWSPHEPIHDRARNALPQFGVAAIGPILLSLREMTALTKEQRDRLPLILATIGPATIPTLVRYLADPHEHVRAVAAAALGHLRARDAVADVAALVADPSDLVRLSAAEALGALAAGGTKDNRSRPVRMPLRGARNWLPWRRKPGDPERPPTEVAVAALGRALGDPLAAVRGAAADSLGRAGAAARGAAGPLAELLRDADETVRCRAAEALGLVGGPAEPLAAALDDASAPVRAAAALGLKALGRRSAGAIRKLIDLLQDPDETVRAAAGAAVAAAGPLDGDSTDQLAVGLSSPDNVVRAQAAEALGTVDAPVESTAPPLVEALADGNDAVRAKAVEALGKIGEAAADVAVPSLVRALRDRDSWVSALAAEALGEMGVCAGVVPGLVRALGHVNAQVRANAAEALGKLGASAGSARPALERAAADEDGTVRARTLRALGALGPPPPSSLHLIRAAVADPDPLVRAAAAAAIGEWDRPPDGVVDELLPLLADPNDQVKIQVCEVLSNWSNSAERIVEGLCQVLAKDDSTWVQGAAAQALTRLGPAAVAAGPALVRLAQTGEAGVREQAMRALVMIQPPEAGAGFESGLTDPTPEVRVMASAGWMRAASVPTSAPALVEALRDPEQQVRANAAHALARLDELPPAAVPVLRDCAGDPNDGLRLNAALALRLAPPGEVADLMEYLLSDPSVRVRLVAAGALLGANPGSAPAANVVLAAADDPNPRVRQAVEELLPLLPAEPPVAVP
jgi:HEAT repeat protein